MLDLDPQLAKAVGQLGAGAMHDQRVGGRDVEPGFDDGSRRRRLPLAEVVSNAELRLLRCMRCRHGALLTNAACRRVLAKLQRLRGELGKTRAASIGNALRKSFKKFEVGYLLFG